MEAPAAARTLVSWGATWSSNTSPRFVPRNAFSGCSPCATGWCLILKGSPGFKYQKPRLHSRRSCTATRAIHAASIPEAALFSEGFSEVLFTIGQQANSLVQSQLSSPSLSPASLGVVFAAGLATSLSPCTLSVLPLTIGYIGGYSGQEEKKQSTLILNSVSFTLGLATTLALLGVGAALAGRAFGQIGPALPITVSFVAILMGLNLLEIVPLALPSFFGDYDPRAAAKSLPPPAQMYLAGLTFALAASPCSTPVLASLLAYVASSQDGVTGGALLLAYTTGYVSPLLLAASATGALKSILSLRQFSAWVNPASGALLLGGGVYSFLDHVFPVS